MHTCLRVDEIVRLLACELVVSGGKAAAAALARCCKNFEDPVLDALWGTQDRLLPLLETFPEDVWDVVSHTFVSQPTTPISSLLNYSIGKVFERMPTTVEWARFNKYARRMHKLKLDCSKEPIPSDVLSVLQLRTLNEPLLPNLKTLELKETAAYMIPFIPLFLSRRIACIDIHFIDCPPPVMVASMIVNFPKLCPYMQEISLQPLLDDSTITHAASEMLLTCNLDTLRSFQVDSHLTEEANRVLFRLPDLQGLWSVFTEHTPLPTASLPGLTVLDVQYFHGHDWLRAFHATPLSKLTDVAFHADCDRIGDFLEAFENIALTTSASASLSHFKFYTSCSWNPNYNSLLSFKQLKELVVEFSCQGGCSSSVDDEIIATLAQAMPKLEILQLGKAPCQVPGNVTVQGLMALARHCPGLSKLRIHFKMDNLTVVLAGGAMPSPSDGESYLSRGDCALTSLEVGEIPISDHHTLPVALTLLRIFPRLLEIECGNMVWGQIADIIRLSKQVDSFVRRSGMTYPLYYLS